MKVYVSTRKDNNNFSSNAGTLNPLKIIDSILYGIKKGHKITIRIR